MYVWRKPTSYLPCTHQPSTIKQRNRPNRTAAPTPQLQREANKRKPPLAHDPIQIVQPFHMRHAALAADVVGPEIHLAFGAWADGFDAC